MQDADRSQEQLLREMEALRCRVAELEALETARRHSGADSQYSEEQSQTYIEQATDLIFTLDPQGLITSVNHAAREVLGYAPEELIGGTPLDLVVPEDREAVVEALDRVLTGQTVERMEAHAFHKDGHRVCLEIRGHIIMEGDRIVETFHIARDITRRKVAEEGQKKALAEALQATQALRESEARYRLLAENVTDVIWAMDLDHNTTYISPSVERLRGYTVEEVMAQSFEELMTPASLETAKQALAEDQAIEASKWRDPSRTRVLELEFTRKDGSTVWTESWLSYQRDEKGRAVGLVGVTRDITGRRQMEEALRRSNTELQTRNQDLDAFIHTMTHGLKNPLGVIVGYAHVLETEYATIPEEDFRFCTQAIARNGRRMQCIVDALLRLVMVRNIEVEWAPLDMARIVTDAQLNVIHLIEEYRAEIIVPQDWPTALGYAPWIEEVWVNYLSNALQYGGRPPRVELGFSVLDFGLDREEQSGLADPDSKMIRFWVRDNGPGLTSAEQESLFNPFTQLERIPSVGHGLGLSIVKRIVERLGGQVEVESKPGAGSTFSFMLPAAPEQRILLEKS
jgi:PAS domain S-box-containing protein